MIGSVCAVAWRVEIIYAERLCRDDMDDFCMEANASHLASGLEVAKATDATIQTTILENGEQDSSIRARLYVVKRVNRDGIKLIESSHQVERLMGWESS